MDSSTHHLIMACGYAAADAAGIHALAFDARAGSLAPVRSFAGITNPSFLITHPRERWLYAVSETAAGDGGVAGSVWALRFGPEEGDDPVAFQVLNHRPSGGDSPCHLRLDATGRWLFVANYSSGSAGVLPILPDGSLGDMTARVQHSGSGPNKQRQDKAYAHSTILSPDNRFAIIADLGTDRLMIYAFDSERGTLTEHGAGVARPGAGPRHTVFHPNGRLLYVANELDSTVSVFDYDAERGALSEIQFASTLPEAMSGNTVADIHITPDGARLYVSNRGDNSIAAYDLDGDGRLGPAAFASCGGNWPRNFAIAPGGRFLLVANQRSDEVSVLPLNDGAVGAAIGSVPVARVACLEAVHADE